MQLRENCSFGIEDIVRRLTINDILGGERLDYRLTIYLCLACGTYFAHLEAKKQGEIGILLNCLMVRTCGEQSIQDYL